MLLLILGDDAFLVRTLLLNGVALVRFLPRINLTRNLIVEVRADNLYTTSGTITLLRLVLVVLRQRTGVLAVFPPHHRLVRRSKALNGSERTIVRELTINRRLTGLTVKRARPLELRLCQPTDMVWLLLQYETAVGDTRTRRTSREVPRLLSAVSTRGVAARLHVTSHDHRVLLWVGVFTPHADPEVGSASQVEGRGTNLIRHPTPQIKGKATLGVRGGVKRRRHFPLARHVLQVNDVALEWLVIRAQIVRTPILIDVRVAVVAAKIAPATLGVDGVRHHLVLALRISSSFSTRNCSRSLLRKRNRLR